MKKRNLYIRMALVACAVACVCVNTARAQEGGREPVSPKIEAFEPDSFFARRQVLRHDVLMLSAMEASGATKDNQRNLYLGMRFMENGLKAPAAELSRAVVGKDQSDYWWPYVRKAPKGKQENRCHVVGFVEGVDPEAAQNVVVVGVRDVDNVASLAVMLELMRYYSQFPMERSLAFVALGSDDAGAWQAFQQSFPFENDRVDAVIFCPPMKVDVSLMMHQAAQLGEALRLLLNR